MDGRKSEIDPAIAQHFRAAYINLPSHPTITRSGELPGAYERVKGFSFPKSEVLRAMESHPDNIGIHLAFGYNTDTTNPELSGVTIILYGIDRNGALVELQGSVFDYSKPCPKNCPGRPEFELPLVPEGD